MLMTHKAEMTNTFKLLREKDKLSKILRTEPSKSNNHKDIGILTAINLTSQNKLTEQSISLGFDRVAEFHNTKKIALNKHNKPNDSKNRLPKIKNKNTISENNKKLLDEIYYVIDIVPLTNSSSNSSHGSRIKKVNGRFSNSNQLLNIIYDDLSLNNENKKKFIANFDRLLKDKLIPYLASNKGKRLKEIKEKAGERKKSKQKQVENVKDQIKKLKGKNNIIVDDDNLKVRIYVL